MPVVSDYLANKLLNLTLRNTSYTPPTTVYLALCVSPGPSDSGMANELTGGAYARQAVTFVASVTGATENLGPISFTNLPAATVTHCAILDAATSGNLLLYGPLANARTVLAGDSISWADGALDVIL